MKKYKVNEIFYSLQAEGYHSGHPSVFIRLSGCNLSCPWCDTSRHNEGNFYTKAEISKHIDKCLSGVSRKDVHLVITGGEPTLQLDKDIPIADNFKCVCIETNGTNPVPYWIDFITCSPKSNMMVENMLFKPQEIKIVYEKNRQSYLKSLAKECPLDIKLYLQPLELDGQMNVDETINFIKQNPRFKLSLQYHKLIGMR